MRTLNLAVGLCVLGVLAGCSIGNLLNGRVEFVPSEYGVKRLGPGDPEAIQVFRSSMPEQKYTEVGTVSSSYQGYGVALKKLKQKAAEYGADAVIDVREAADGITIRLTATAIKFERE